MIRYLASLYLPGYPTTLVYMLQSSEYNERAYLKWLHRTKDFSSVMQRRSLERTKPARLLLLALRVGIICQILLALTLIYLDITGDLTGGTFFGLALILIYPLLWPYLLLMPLLLGRWLISGPSQKQKVAVAEQVFANHDGLKIAVVGSYGKTSMKELLAVVLSRGFKVAATPANKNVSVSHAEFAAKLEGDEDVLIIEYGEGEPGDVARFAQRTHPTQAVITGLAPAHLDKYPSLQAAGQDIFSITDYLKGQNIYVNADSDEVKPFLSKSYNLFGRHGCLGWRTSNIKSSLDGTSFTLKKGSQTLKLQSQLIGKHQVGFLAFVAAFGLELGLTAEQVKAGIAETKPFEHRMQPYQLNGAWIVDDTYNGNIEGIKAGTELLREIEAKRKIYITPGLVDQGVETERVHLEVGKLIAAAKPDLVVLMNNSVTKYIEKGLKAANYDGKIQIEDSPLDFYSNVNHFVAAGDLLVMQNDWTDNYA